LAASASSPVACLGGARPGHRQQAARTTDPGRCIGKILHPCVCIIHLHPETAAGHLRSQRTLRSSDEPCALMLTATQKACPQADKKSWLARALPRPRCWLLSAVLHLLSSEDSALPCLDLRHHADRQDHVLRAWSPWRWT
jgi:hypothetical protein